MKHNVYIYLFDKLETLSERFVENNIDKLPEFRRNRCVRYRRDADKRACIISYLLLQQGLNEKFGITEHVEFIYNDHAKPYLADYPYIFFNLSHCEKGIVCAVADFEIGIDIQDIVPFDPAVAGVVCGSDEMRLLAASEDPARLFCKLWTTKESYAKAQGLSVVNVLDVSPPESMVSHRDFAEYCVALCCRNFMADQIQIEWLYPAQIWRE